MNIQRTCVLLKPDALENGVIGKIISKFEEKKLKVVAAKLMQLTEVLLQEHYAHVVHEPFFGDLESFMISSPVLAMVLEGEDAVDVVRKMTGKNFQDEGTIRGEFASCERKNTIHSSDSLENARSEIARFFDATEVF